MIDDEITTQFLHKIRRSIQADTFARLTLSKPGSGDVDVKNVYARPVVIKGREMLSFTLRYATKDVVKNYSLEEGLTMVALWLGKDFLNGDLFSLVEDVSIQFNKKRKARIFIKKPSLSERPSTRHDHKKKRLIVAQNKLYLQELGIVNADGNVLKKGQKKFRQINKYIEIIDSLIRQCRLSKTPHIADLGSGKGYLTFALYDYLHNSLHLNPLIKGIEQRKSLVEFCNKLAGKAGFEGLHFLAEDIHDFHPEGIEMLIALHACDTATDTAIAKGIKAGATIIIVAPCCHKQIRRQMHCSTDMQAILKYGILEERQAELITDGLRALLMEVHGYKTKVFEFVSTEHTPKNLMIVGIKGKKKPEALKKVESIKKEYGIGYHYLEKLLDQ